MTEQRQKRYGFWLSILFMLAWGTLFWDRLVASQESDVIKAALSLSDVQFTALTALSSLFYAISGIVIGAVSDRTGLRKRLLVPFMAVCGLLAFACSICRSYPMLLALRMAAGFFEGPSLTLMTAILVQYSFPGTFGRNSGIVAAGVSVVANTLGPVVVTRLITARAWTTPYAVTGALQILFALLILFLSREVQPAPHSAETAAAPLPLRKNRNFLLCAGVGVFGWVGYWSTQIFAPIYLSDIMGMAPVQRGTVSAVMGFVFIFTQLLVPWISDRIGRRPALAGAYLVAILSPLGMWLLPGTTASVVGYCVCGGMVATTSALFAGVIPMESLPDSQKASACGLIMGVAEIVGGTVWPLAAGAASELIGGVRGIMAVVSVLFVFSAVCALFLRETRVKS